MIRVDLQQGSGTLATTLWLSLQIWVHTVLVSMTCGDQNPWPTLWGEIYANQQKQFGLLDLGLYAVWRFHL